jgi:hypothetical protein
MKKFDYSLEVRLVRVSAFNCITDTITQTMENRFVNKNTCA